VPERPPNLILIVTDQQRSPQHWPTDPAWLDALMPADAELRRTGMTFNNAFIASAMCSPSRASIFTGRYPARHGVTLTMTHGDLFPDPKNFPSVMRTAGRLALSGEVPRGHLARQFTRGLLRMGPKAGNEPQLSPSIPTLGTLLRERGYHVALKGKWHVTKPTDAAALERDHGFSDWDPTDAGGDVKATNFGGGRAGTSGLGWDEDYTRQVEAWLSQADLPEPFCLVWCLVNPHDVLAYPSSFAGGGYTLGEFADLHVPLPPTIDEDLRSKPTVQAMTKVGQASYLGSLGGRAQEQSYANFYAHLHRVVDRKIARVVDLLGAPEDPASLRARTVVVRTSDHGELGLAHGGLRQKMFNAYEEAIHVPLIVSHPGSFPEPRRSDALVSLVDLVPTMLGLSGRPATDPGAFDGLDLGPVLRGDAEAVRDAVLFTYDDHQAGTALQDAPGQPNRIRAIRDARWKYAVYLDPSGRVAPEYELYDLRSDPAEAVNLVDKHDRRGRTPEVTGEAERLHALLERACARAQVPLWDARPRVGSR
jgi:choline-sulfatase